MKKSIKNQSKKSKQQTSNSKTLNNDTLEIKRVPLFDFIKNQLGGIELTPDEMKELEPERPVINYSVFPINPDEDYEYDF